MRQGDLEIVRTYRFPHEAWLAKSVLEAFGVTAWVLDETQIRHRWFMGVALGDVKLAVRSDQTAQAREILDGDHSDSLASIPEELLAPSGDEICGQCGAPELVTERTIRPGRLPQWLLTVATMLLAGGPAPHYRVQTLRRCRRCEHVSVSDS